MEDGQEERRASKETLRDTSTSDQDKKSKIKEDDGKAILEDSPVDPEATLTDTLEDRGSRDTRAVPNDRQIPMYLQDDVERVLGIYNFDRERSKFRSKGVQTRIGGVRSMSDSLEAGDTSPRGQDSNERPWCETCSSELSLTRSYLHNVHSNYQRLKQRFHKLHEDYYKLIRVAGLLTNALENSARGCPVDLPATLNSCINVYPDLFNQNVRDDSAERKRVKSDIETYQNETTPAKPPILGIVPISPKHFDYKKIKLHLINGNVKTKLLLLQALRWKITLSQPAERDEAIHEYTSSDLMGLHGQIATDTGKSILPYLFIPRDVALPHPLQQSAARFLNTLASLKCGRDYLSADSTVLNVLVQCLDTAQTETADPLTGDMIIATLQKLSLRRQQRLYMIGIGLLEWLVYHLKSESWKIGTYRLEYATALLMNLSLHREAQVRAATMTTLLLSALTELLSSAHLPALPYVNGALNNFLENHTINEEAKKIGLESVLEYHRKRHSGDIRKHLDHILERHRRESEDGTVDDAMIPDEDSDELDVLENELDELDPVKVHAGELFGEALLASCYSASSNDQQRPSLVDRRIPTSPSRFESSRSKELRLNEAPRDEDEFPAADEIISARDSTSILGNTARVSAWENSTEAEKKTRAIARPESARSGTEEEPRGRKIDDEGPEEEAFLSKPRIARTPTHSGGTRVSSSREEKKWDNASRPTPQEDKG